MPTIRLTFESKLPVTPEQSWAWATSVRGISAELWPIMKMTTPKHIENLLDLEIRPGEPLFRSWILLLGVLPIDRSELTLLEVEPGQRFLEQSPMLSMSLWRHERVIALAPGGSTVTDRLEFEPRFARTLVTWFIRTVFTHRHAVLRRNLR